MSEVLTAENTEVTPAASQNPDPAQGDVSSDPSPSPAEQVSDAPATDSPPSGEVSGQDTAGDVPDWIERAGRKDEARIDRLKRFGDDPGALLDSYLHLEARLSKRGPEIPGEGATDEERAAFAKRVGIPETPDGYDVKPELPEGFEFSEDDKPFVDSITKELHSRGGVLAHPEVIKAAQEVYAKSLEEAYAQQVAAAQQAHEETQAAIAKEWGRDKDKVLTMARNVIERYSGADGDEMKEMFRLPLANGAMLGDYLPFLRMMGRIGREFGDDPLFAEMGGATPDTMASLEDERAKIMELRAKGDFKGYGEKQDRLRQINEALARQKSRKAS